MNKLRATILLLLLSQPVCANTGIPMILATLPLMVVALVPLVLLEAFVVTKVIRVTYKVAAKTMLVANVITTFVGLPLSNLIGYCVSHFGYAIGINPYNFTGSTNSTIAKAIFYSWWLDPVQWVKGADGGYSFPQEPRWYVFLAILFALLVNYFISWYIEYLYMRKKIPVPDVKRAALYANATSYAAICVTGLVWYVVA